MKSFNPRLEIEKTVSFLQSVFKNANKTKAVIAVSGGIDSAVSLSLLTQAIGSDNIYPLFLPYEDQDMTDAKEIVAWNKIPESNVSEINISPMVKEAGGVLEAIDDSSRLGNIMARSRMICVFDTAKKRDALVCGTENKSEKYLGYFTRFGDGASDIEPITHLYKTQVREVAKELGLPSVFLDKAPSAGLWAEQTDEQELGFSYSEADQVLEQLIDEGIAPEEIKLNLPADTISRVVDRVKLMNFKQEVPYFIE